MALVNRRHSALAPLWLLLGLLLPLAVATSAANDGEAPLEKRVKAAFLYKFAGYVDWPAGVFAAADSPLVFGVLGDSSLAEELDRAADGRSIEARPLRVKRLSAGDDFAGVNVLFVATGTAVAEALRATNARPMLVVTESESALSKGSVINFIVVDGRVRFEISTAGAEERGLKLSSRLLAVAYNLRSEEVR
jgi:hypothetical protein